MTELPPVRVGAVAYLNTRPLVEGLAGAPGIDLSFAVPSELARQLADGDLDVALLPTIELARIPGLVLLPGLGIECDGAVRSVLLVSRRPLSLVRRVALDPESRTSNALTQVLFHERFGDGNEGRVEFEPAPAGATLAELLEDHDFDAAVRIGDKALGDPIPEGVEAHDLGAAWLEATGRPFVFAAWVARGTAATTTAPTNTAPTNTVPPSTLERLEEAYALGRSRIDAIAREHASTRGIDAAVAASYLRDNIRFELDDEAIEAIRVFHTLAARHGITTSAPDIVLGPRPRPVS